ncbi:hypothetical protein KY359_00125 [Candidatus Woesearchaeota archaeon]|nr:hypothetical protein [Candidatus Woesearchaeota archaeon]
MVINTVILKASYDLMTEAQAYAYAIRKFASDVARGSELRTFKMMRFVDSEGFDTSKFTFPVCGNLSSADLMVVYCAMAGFNTVVVGNAERGRRDQVIRETLGLENILSVPELDLPVELDDGRAAMNALSFTNTQRRGFAALNGIPDTRLVLEVAADQPLMYDVYRHAVDLSKEEVDFAINFNAVNLMKSMVPSFVRNGYDKVFNSRGEEVVFKENNNFAQDRISMEHNPPLFRFLYENRNGGRYLAPQNLVRGINALSLVGRLGHLIFVEGFRVRKDTPNGLIDEIWEYGIKRRTLGKTAPYSVLMSVVNAAASPTLLSQRAYVDATNDDIFSCWDMDGWNNDFLGYRTLFRRNFSNLGRILPFAEQVYRVDEVLAKKGREEGITTESYFQTRYHSFVRGLMWRLRNRDYLRSLHLSGRTADKVTEAVRDSGIEVAMLGGESGDVQMIVDLERHLETHCMQRYQRDREQYEVMRNAA